MFLIIGTETSKNDTPEAKILKIEAESPKQSSEKGPASPSAAVDSAAQSGRASRRSRN